MPARSNTRAALLAVTMNLVPVAAIDVFRFLRVPAIVMTIKQVKGRVCRDRHEAHARRRTTVS
ncbi:MAG TPA: hypothetical protein VF911_08365 [Thermoanaerobaculia bacterium]|jgi:hypothetical protein